MSILNEYYNYDGIELALLIKNKEINPEELLETVIARAENLNPKINFFSNKLYDYARTALKLGLPQGPYTGVPFLLKDLGTLCKNTITTHGSVFYKDYIADHDSECIKRFKAAGLLFFGKTSTPEFGLSFSTEPLLFGPCRNPWNLNLTAGGSSGGSAAAVAARIVPVAHASDGGGSIRIPASCCGLFGLKPTRARVPMGPDLGEGWGGLATHHVISISVRDSAAMLDIISGPELGDPYYAPHKLTPYLEAIKRPPKQLRIAITELFEDNIAVHPECKIALQDTAKLCESLGHIVIPARPKFNKALLQDAIHIIASTNTAMFLKLREQSVKRTISSNDIEPTTAAFIEFGKNFLATDYAQAIFILHNQSRQISQFFVDYDILLTPTTVKPAVKIGLLASNTTDVEKYFINQQAFGPNTAVANATGQPAMSVPLYWTEDNIPIGTQFIARFGDEATLFQLAAQLEQARPWKHKLPTL